MVFNVGEHVIWWHTPRGGYGSSVPVAGVVVRPSGAKHAVIRVQLVSGEEVERRVSLKRLRKPEVGV